MSRGARMAGAAVAGLRGAPAAEPVRDGPRLSPARYRADLREGYAFPFRARLPLGITVMVRVTNGLNQSWSSVPLPVHTRGNPGGPATQGLLVAVFGGCAFAGALLCGAVGERLPRRAVFTAGSLVGGAPPYVVAALTDTTAPLLATAATLLGIGTLSLLATLAPLAFPTWRKMDSRPAPTVPEGISRTEPSRPAPAPGP
ncbi:hypothetical protein [Streptomyces sp. NPDC090093]|uniref:hypothetical protein n=1 Tax=Streptomyces sp. NPDC090093 TaxID=3365945 RepID=UPI0037F46378